MYTDATQDREPESRTRLITEWERAMYHARQVKLSSGQSKWLHIRQCIDNIKAGLQA